MQSLDIKYNELKTWGNSPIKSSVYLNFAVKFHFGLPLTSICIHFKIWLSDNKFGGLLCF